MAATKPRKKKPAKTKEEPIELQVKLPEVFGYLPTQHANRFRVETSEEADITRLLFGTDEGGSIVYKQCISMTNHTAKWLGGLLTQFLGPWEEPVEERIEVKKD